MAKIQHKRFNLFDSHLCYNLNIYNNVDCNILRLAKEAKRTHDGESFIALIRCKELSYKVRGLIQLYANILLAWVHTHIFHKNRPFEAACLNFSKFLHESSLFPRSEPTSLLTL